MGFYSTLIQRFGYPLFDAARGRHMWQTYQELNSSQWLSPDEIRDTQWRRLKALLAHSYENVPFYRNRFRALGATPEDITTWEDLESIPPLTKNDIRNEHNLLVANNAQQYRISPGRTGGSTGKPTHFMYSMRSRDYSRASVLRNVAWAGLQVGDRYITVSGSHFDHSRGKRIGARLTQALLKQVTVSALDLSPAKTRDYLETVRKYRPKVLWGYASAIYALASMAQEMGIDDITFKAVITSSDTLFASQRKVIEDTFHCDVFDLYSSREFHMAGECERHEGYHISAESLVVQVERDGHGVLGEDGDVLVTDLHNYGFPFIRYRIGDVGRLTTRRCSCGRGLPLMESITGRVEDFVVTPSGRAISPPAFTVLFGDVAAVRDYQIVQTRPDAVTVNIVKEQHFSQADMAHLEAGMTAILGADICVDYAFVLQIKRGESGKRRVVISSVPTSFRAG